MGSPAYVRGSRPQARRMRYLLERFPPLLRESKNLATFVRAAAPLQRERLSELPAAVSVWRPRPCLQTELPRSSGQITGLQIVSRRETKGFVFAFGTEAKNRESFRETPFETELVIVRLLFFLGWGWGGGWGGLEVFLHVLQAFKLLREWTRHLIVVLQQPPTPFSQTPLMAFGNVYPALLASLHLERAPPGGGPDLHSVRMVVISCGSALLWPMTSHLDQTCHLSEH